MKKSLILVGVLSIGYASAQTEADYDGKVGINTDKPTATIQVKSKTGWDNSTKNLELTNAADKQLVTVLDNGNVGIQAQPTNDMFNIYNKLRYNPNNRSMGLGLSSYSSQWARGYNFVSEDGATLHGGFQAYGTGDNVKFYFVGKEFVNPLLKVETATGNVGVALGNADATQKLDVDGNARLRALPTVAGANTDKVVVVDNTGVLKTVEQSTLSAGTALPNGSAVGQTLVWNGTAWEAKTPEAGGANLSALTGKIHKAASITVEEWVQMGIFAFIQTGPGALQLPDPANYLNKIISVGNQSGSGLNYAGTNNPLNVGTLEAGKGHLLMSDGTTWYVIGGSY